jgi:hypothetical protein
MQPKVSTAGVANDLVRRVEELERELRIKERELGEARRRDLQVRFRWFAHDRAARTYSRMC